MGSNWAKVTIESIQANQKGAIAIGPFGSRLKSDSYVDSGIPVIRGTNLTDGATFTGEFVFISQEKADSLGSSNVYQNDLVFPHRGSIGEVGIITDNKRYILSSSLMKLTVDVSQVNPKYLYYFFRSSAGRHELLKNSSQVGTPGIGQPLTSLKSIEFEKPSLEEQDKIVKILSDLDNKITLNRQINQTLEQMAQALFKSWFVDFDPVVDNALDAGFFEQDLEFPDELLRRAEARKAVRESADFKPLPEDIRQLFPAAFEKCSEPSLGLGGWVPEEWKNVAIYSLADFVNGAAYKAFEPNQEQRGLPIIKIAELKAGVTFQTAFSDRDMPEKYRLKTGDILFSWSGNPDTSIDTFIWTHGDAWLNQHIFKITPPNGPGERSFVLMALKYLKPIFAEIARNKQTTGLGHVTIADLKRLQIVKPEPRVLAAWDSVVNPYVNQAFTLTQQAQTLANLRDALLPNLISGKLRLDEIEKLLVEEI
ncbi:type I restriction endonuclease subunit S [Hafnia alvei]|uniref:restriction endonuclease subunit S n=1 Tax=Hafnia alvei TaxID=569 RepID=UPI000DAAEDA9|nr:restriction endonuclease subunit S [Hafnia alvei]AWV46277.1 type I restriction endonuclease subunit S [Hafnia alvei]